MLNQLLMMRIIRFSVIAFFCAICSIVSAEDYVDLGLSVKWGTVNMGTTEYRPYGGYWNWADAMAITTTDGSRMATKAEWSELLEYCSWKWTEQNGKSGYLVTSNIKGYKGNSIFLPASGWLQDGNLMQLDTYASYWAATPGVQPGEQSAYGFNFQRGATEWHSENRASEQSVRMVMPLSGKELGKLSFDRKKLDMEQSTIARLGVLMSKRNVNSASTWKSSDENVVSVTDDGLIAAIAPGTCTLTVQAYGRSAECTVTVTPNDVEFVDMGLGVLWATRNIGAAKPSDYGNYYAWAEIEPKDFYSWNAYRYCSTASGYRVGLDKYTTEGQTEFLLKPDNLDRLEPMDDIASVISGGKWHMPTSDDFKELILNSSFDTDSIDGIKGIRFTSKVPGFEDRSIFMPFAGCMNGNEPKDSGSELYVWSATAGRGTQGVYLDTYSAQEGRYYDASLLDRNYSFLEEKTAQPNLASMESRFVGMSVRPVKSLGNDMFTSLSFGEDHLDMQYGQITEAVVKMMPAGRPVNEMNVTWGSSNPDIAQVADGYLTAVGQGNCIITAESGGKKAELAVSVSLPVPEPVDLGLSVMWASANLGASLPDEPGGYFMWGETSPKAGLYTGDKYKFGQYTNETTKYNFYTNSWGGSKYPLDYKASLDPEDDAAIVLLGDGWRMPTADELWELKTKCTWEAKFVEDTIEYKYDDTVEVWFEKRLLGYVITSNVPGYEGRSIYLPAAGYISDYISGFSSGLVNGGAVYYWTSTLDQSLGNMSRRFHGVPIRPVKEIPESEGRGKVKPDPVKPLKHNAMVDLGLSVLWADCNVGADKPEEPGSRFAWGETTQKIYYSEYNYKHMAAFKDENKWWYSKYVPSKANSNDPYTDGKTRLDPEDDAARVNWGGKWRMPTKEDYKELYEKCEWKEDSINGVKGYRITSRVPGYTQNSIFLPYNSSLGLGDDFFVTNNSEGYYLTSDLSSQYTNGCVTLAFSKYKFGTSDEVELDFGDAEDSFGGSKMTKIHITSRDRVKGFSVRAVCAKGDSPQLHVKK